MLRSIVCASALLALCVSAGFYDSKSSEVVNLSPENFDSTLLQSTDLWIVEFYAPWCGHCKNLAPEWEKAAKEVKGTNVHFAAVDADKYGELGGKYGVRGFPTIKVFGADKAQPQDYEGKRSAPALVSYAKRQWQILDNKRNGIDAPVPEEAPKVNSEFYEGTDVVELSDDTFEAEVVNGKEPWLIEFYAPWCGHCKNLSPEWKKAATALAGSVRLGAVDATEYKKWAGKYKVEGFPTIKFIPPGNPDAAEDYNGGRSSDAIIEYGLKKAELYPSGPLVVAQVENQAALEALCSKKTLCVVFIVPHVFDTGAAGRQKLIELFGDVAGKLRGKSVTFGWIAGGEHEKFEHAFNIHSTYPTYAALNYKNLRATTHIGSFTLDSIVTSIKKVIDGKTSVGTLKSLPQLSKNVPLWDGKDYVAPEDDE